MTFSEIVFSYFGKGIITYFIVVLFRFFLQFCVPRKIDIILAHRLEPMYLLICLQQKINMFKLNDPKCGDVIKAFFFLSFFFFFSFYGVVVQVSFCCCSCCCFLKKNIKK